MPEFAIQVRDLRKTYPGKPPVEAVRGLNLEVKVGECFGFLGPNGAGKTTTIEILEGLLQSTSGHVEILGLTWEKNADEIRQRIGVSLQETVLTDKLTVIETLRLFRSFFKGGLSPEEAMKSVSLEEKANSLIKKLSGGQKQRLAVATALVGDPDLLFLDEPTTGLDPQSRRQLWDIITNHRARGKTILLTTHYMDEAEKLCDRVAIIDHGQVIALGTPAELIAQLGADHVIQFKLVEEESGTRWSAEDAQGLAELPGGVSHVHRDENRISFSSARPHETLPELFQLLQKRQLKFEALTTRHASLEDVFVSIAGRSLEA